MNKDLVAIFEYLEREKGIKRDIVVGAIEESLQIAARKSIQGLTNVTVAVNPKSGEIEVFTEKEIVEDVEIPEEEISLEIAREIDPDCQLGQWIKVEVTPENFGRIAAQTAKQVISQKLRGAERDVIYEEYRHRLNEIVSGTVKRIVRGGTLIVDLGKVEAILPDRFYPKVERYQVGQRIQALILEVRDTENGGAEVVLSRSHPEVVAQLFMQEVPELMDGIIEIKRIVRDAGYRTKIAVTTTDNRVDPLGACVGVRGTRVKNIIRELNNEKIDILPFSEDPIDLLRSALDPIQIKKLEWDKEENKIMIVVDDEDYPTVLGKKGMNARLNGKLIEMELLVRKSSEHQKELRFDRHRLALSDDPELDQELEIEGVNQFVVDSLKDAGFDTLRKLLNATPEDLVKEASISQDMANDILDKIQKKRT
ncbi:MAG: Transcription termination/antitermination protein NusA [Chlamydiia bacterium]|nr:Transcription termination/antitermination protein NusA [Chlamydiia bacterium]